MGCLSALANFVNNSTYYAQLSWEWITYMERIVRPCLAYSTGTVDGIHNSTLSTATGMNIVRGATRLVVGERPFFIGNDESSKFLSDIWAPSTNFNRFLCRAVSFMESAGTAVIKWNKDEHDRNYLTAYRMDRAIVSTNDNGDVVDAVFFVSLLSNAKNDAKSSYWLVEERKYSDVGKPVIVYKVFTKSGTVEAPVLPSPHLKGVDYRFLPRPVREELARQRITKLNEEVPLPCHDGLGVWLMARTATNSCVPDSPFGDPLLYGCLDLLWSIDVVFSGSLVDVLNGEGKILVPKQFLQDTLSRLHQQYPNSTFQVTTAELNDYKDESFVYIMPSMFDKDQMAPTPVQFDIRAEQYGRMLEIYERMAAVRAGFSPTSIFPYLTPDNSAKTAREVTAEENLTRASIKETHAIILPVLTRALREILRQEGYSPDISLQLSDYIGNKLEFDENVRQNYSAKLLPREIAVKQINGLTDSETDEYLQKIADDIREEMQYDSEQTIEQAGNSVGKRGNGTPPTNQDGVF